MGHKMFFPHEEKKPKIIMSVEQLRVINYKNHFLVCLLSDYIKSSVPAKQRRLNQLRSRASHRLLKITKCMKLVTMSLKSTPCADLKRQQYIQF